MATIFQRGTVFGPYTIGDLLGSGAVSEVYEATTMADDAVVAIKVLKGGAPPHAKREARLGQEGLALADVVHVNVAGFREEGSVDGRPYLAMERVYGIDLRRLMAEEGGLLPLARAVRIAYQAAEGLAAVHERGILHRDVKPENVLVTPDDLVKITDFGSAWVGKFGVETTREHDLTSLLYASPEHLRRHPIVPASDVYALGVVVYEMAAGVHPIVPGRATAPEIFTRQLVFHPPPLYTLSSDDRPIPRDLSDLVVRMLDKDPAKRPASSDLGPALRAVLRPLLARHRAGGRVDPGPHDADEGVLAGRDDPDGGRRRRARVGRRVEPHRSAPVTMGASPPSAGRTGRCDARGAPTAGTVGRVAGPGDGAGSRRGHASIGGARSGHDANVRGGLAVARGTTPPDPGGATLDGGARGAAGGPGEQGAEHAAESIAVASVVLGLGAAGAGWFVAGRDGGSPSVAPAAPRHDGAAGASRPTVTTGGPQRSPQAPPAPATSASTSGIAAVPPAETAAPASRLRSAPKRGKIPVP